MKSKALIVTLICLFSFEPTFASIYRCMVNGKLIFSDRPCTGKDTDIIYMESTSKKKEIDRSENKNNFPKRNVLIDNEDKSSNVDCRSKTINKIKMKYLIKSDEIKRQKDKIKDLRLEQDAKLLILKDKKRYASNNIAGATCVLPQLEMENWPC